MKGNTKTGRFELLLDSYAWVEFFNGTEKGKKVKAFLEKENCFTSAISIAELSEWIERERLNRKEKMREIKTLSSVLSLDLELLELAGIVKIQKRRKEKGFGLIDAIILATAKTHGLKIVTGDKHFKEEKAVML